MSKKYFWKRIVPYLTGFFIVGPVVAGIYFMMDYFEKPVHSRKQVQQISIIQPPPPPPPRVDQPPPPPEVEETVEIPEPEDLPEELPELADAAAAGDQLGLDAEGGAGSDGFGLAARKGGRGLLAGGGDAATRFGSVLKRKIEDVLSGYDNIRNRNYRVVVTFKVSSGGLMAPSLKSSTGDPAIDATIREALQRIASLSEQPPADVLGKTIRFRIGV
ncbi:MAG: TonB C-terminal domain-containing protein [Methylococcales bacterium]